MIEGIQGVSSFSAEIDYAFWVVNLICLFLFVITIGAMFLFIYQYNEKKSKPEDTKNIKHNTPLEIAWTIIPTILMMVIFYVGLDALKIQRTMPADDKAIVVKVLGQKWSWSFEYSNGKKSSKLIVPINKDVKLLMETPINDVLHAFFVPAFRIKEDLVPGQVTRLWFNAQKEGTYDILCAEFCGTRHSYMRSSVVVVSSEKFQDFLYPKVEVVKSAEDIFSELGCIGCHSTDGSILVGPSFKDIYNKEVKVTSNGKTRTIIRDEKYLIKAINDPDADIVDGYFQGVMPPFKGFVNDKDMKTIINYFKGIKEEIKVNKISGKEIADINGCTGCHSIDGSVLVGPTFKGIYNRATKINVNGSIKEIIADDEYLRDAIINPAKHIVDGYSNIMPPFKDVLKDEEVEAIIQYLKE